MSMLKGMPENREIAFRVYVQFGGRNVPAMLETLEKDYGMKISAQTLYQWRREGNWTERLKEPSYEEAVLLKLKGLIEKLGRRLEKRSEPDAQDVYAFTNTVSTFFRLSMNRKTPMRDPEEMWQVAKEILETEYGIKRD